MEIISPSRVLAAGEPLLGGILYFRSWILEGERIQLFLGILGCFLCDLGLVVTYLWERRLSWFIHHHQHHFGGENSVFNPSQPLPNPLPKPLWYSKHLPLSSELREQRKIPLQDLIPELWEGVFGWKFWDKLQNPQFHSSLVRISGNFWGFRAPHPKLWHVQLLDLVFPAGQDGDPVCCPGLHFFGKKSSF